MALAEKVKGDATILAPDGSVATLASEVITAEELALLRSYKKFLQHHGLREALYCQSCWDGNREDGCRAHVTAQEAVITCRCTVRIGRGMAI